MTSMMVFDDVMTFVILHIGTKHEKGHLKKSRME